MSTCVSPWCQSQAGRSTWQSRHSCSCPPRWNHEEEEVVSRTSPSHRKLMRCLETSFHPPYHTVSKQKREALHYLRRLAVKRNFFIAKLRGSFNVINVTSRHLHFCKSLNISQHVLRMHVMGFCGQRVSQEGLFIKHVSRTEVLKYSHSTEQDTRITRRASFKRIDKQNHISQLWGSSNLKNTVSPRL